MAPINEEFTSWSQDRCLECNSLILQLTGGEWVHKASWLANSESPHHAQPGGIHKDLHVERNEKGEPLPGSIDMVGVVEKWKFIHIAMLHSYGSRFWEDFKTWVRLRKEFAATMKERENNAATDVQPVSGD
jgi:hypothetical protein